MLVRMHYIYYSFDYKATRQNLGVFKLMNVAFNAITPLYCHHATIAVRGSANQDIRVLVMAVANQNIHVQVLAKRHQSITTLSPSMAVF